MNSEDWPWGDLLDGLAAGGNAAHEQDFSLNDWLAEGARGLRQALATMGIDDEFWSHLWAAERELLLAWRCLIDARLQRWEERERDRKPDPIQRQNIQVEFE